MLGCGCLKRWEIVPSGNVAIESKHAVLLFAAAVIQGFKLLI